MSVSRTSSPFCIKVILNNGLFPLWDFHTGNHGCCIDHVFIMCMTYSSRHFIYYHIPAHVSGRKWGITFVKFTHIKLSLLLVQNAGGSNSSVMFDISLHMSQGGNGVLHYQINSHKVDFTFSPKCWGSNSSVMFDISRWFAMILKFPDSLGSSHCEVTCTGR